MGADLVLPLFDLRPLCVSVAGGESRKTFTQYSKRENEKRLTKWRSTSVALTAVVALMTAAP